MTESRTTPNRRFEDRKEFLSELAINTAMSCPHKVFGTVKVFFIGNGWHTDWIRKQDNIYKPTTIKAFETALGDDKTKTLFLDGDLFVPLQALEYFCLNAQTAKIVFVESALDDV